MWTARVFAAFVVAGTLVMLFLASKPGNALLARVITAAAEQFVLNDTRLHIQRLDSRFLTRLHFYDIRLVQAGETAVTLDSLHLRFRILPLLRRSVHIKHLHAGGFQLMAHQRPDSAWNFSSLLQPFETPDEPTAWRIRLDTVSVHHASAEVRPLGTAMDSLLFVRLPLASASRLRFGNEPLRGRIHVLELSAFNPDTTRRLDFGLRGSLTDESLLVDTLFLASAESNLYGSGTLPLGVRAAQDTRFDIQVPRLAFSDLRLFLPGLDSLGWVSGHVVAAGAADSLNAVVAIQATDGMSMRFETTAQWLSDGRTRFDLTGSTTRLDPAYLTGNPALKGDLNAILSGTITATKPSDARGDITLEMAPSRWMDGHISGAVLAVTLEDGAAEVLLDARAFDSEIHLEAAARLFDEQPTYRLTANLVDFRYPLHPPEPSLFVLSGTIEVVGKGLDLPSASLAVQSTFDRLSIGACEFPNSHLEAGVDGQQLSFALDLGGLDMPTGPTLTARGEMGFMAPITTVRLLEAKFVGLDPGCISPEWDSGRLTGSMALRGSWTDAKTHDLTGNVLLTGSAFGTVPIDSLDLRVLTRNGLFNLQASLASGEGSLEASGKGSFSATPWPFSLQGSFQHIDLSQYLPPDTPPSDLSASFETSGLVGSSGLVTANLDLILLNSRWNKQLFTEGALEARLDGEDIRFTATVRTPEGRIAAEGTGFMADERIRLDPLGLAFEGVDAAALLDLEGVETNLSGGLDGWIEISGNDPLAADLILTLSRSSVNRSTISAGTTHLLATGGEVRVQLEAQIDSGNLFASAVAYPWEPLPHYEALARVQNLDIFALASREGPRSNISGAAAFSLDRGPEGSISAGGMVSLAPSSIADVRLDTLLAEAALDQGMLLVDTLWIVSSAGSVSGDGPIAIMADASGLSNFRIGVSIDALSELRSLTKARVLEGKGTISGRVSGTFERQRFELIPELEYLIVDDLRVAGFQGRISGERPFTTAWEADLQAGFIANPYVPLQGADLEIVGGAEQAQWRTRIVIDGQRTVRMSGRLEMEADLPRLLFDNVDIRLGPDTWSLLQEASLTLQSPYRIRNFLIAAGSQQMAVDGIVDLQGELNLIFTTEGLRAGAVADLFGYEGLDGALNTFLVLSGTADNPEISGGFRLDDIVSRGRSVGSLNTELAYANGRLNLDARLLSGQGQELTASGFIPLVISLTGLEDVPEDLPTDLTIQTQGFPIGWVVPFLDPTTITAMDGLLTADIRVGGTQGTPDLTGSASVSSGSITLFNTRVRYTDIEIRTRLSGRNMQIDQAELRSGGGSLRASGAIEFISLTRQEYDLKIDAENFRAIHTDTYRGSIGGKFELGGTSEAPTLTGNVLLGPMDVFLTDELTAEELEFVRLTPRDLQILEARFGYRISKSDTTMFNFYQALRMDLSVEIDRDVWLRSSKAPQMDVEFNGRIDVNKEPFHDPHLYGTIQVNPRRSVVRQYGRRFEVRNGSLRFNGPFDEILVDFQAAYVVPARRGESGPTIFLNIEGRLESLEIVPSSEPSMEMIDIVSYIATGRPAAEGLFGGGTGLDAQAAGIALGQLGMLIEGVAGEGLGLDVVEFENDGLRGATFTVGKYVYLDDLRLYASLKQPFNLSKGEETARTTRNTEAAVEIQIFKAMLLRLTSRSRSLRFDLLYEYAY